MPTATNDPTTPTRRSAIGFSLAAFAAGLTATAPASSTPVNLSADTPIAALNRRLGVLVQQRDEMDHTLIRMDEGPEHDALKQAFDDNLDQCLGLYDEIVLLPAHNLGDAAVQSAIAYYRADQNIYALQSEEDAAQLSKDLRMLLSSIFVAITRAADLDIDRIGSGDMGYLCARWPAGGKPA